MTFLSKDNAMVHASEMLPSVDKTLLRTTQCHLTEGSSPSKKGGCHSSNGLEPIISLD